MVAASNGTDSNRTRTNGGAANGRARLFRVALALIPVLFFAGLELGLRAFDYDARAELFLEVEAGGKRYYRVNPRVVRRYFSDEGFATYVSRDRFLAEKPAGTYRIFCLGASTTIGFPYLFNGAYSSLLHDRLAAAFPERHIEVVNLGITAVNSFTVEEFAREVMAYEPDLLVVYAGHNEFYGALGVGSTESVGGRVWLVRTYLALQRSAVFALVRDVVRAAVRAAAGGGEAEEGQLMERMVRDQQIPYGSERYHAAMDAYRSNLERVLRTAQDRGVDVLLSTVVSNLRDQPPFVSVHDEGLSPEEASRWAALFERGRAAEAGARWDEAADYYRRALALDDARADAHYRLARCLEAAGDSAAALPAYRRARDLDALRFRASGELNEAVRALAAAYDVPLVDMESVFERHAPAGIPGRELFWEHVHPTLEGYFIMGRALAEGMQAHGLMAPAGAWSPLPPDSLLRRRAGVTPLDHEVARLRIEGLTSRWPFRREALPVDYQPSTPMQTIAWAYVRGEIGWGAAHDRMATSHAEEGRLGAAADEYWALAKVSRYDPHFFIVAGDHWARQRRFEDAETAYLEALRVEDRTLVHAKLGLVLHEVGRHRDAARRLEQALEPDETAADVLPVPLRVQAAYVLGIDYLHLNDAAGARAQLRRIRAWAPNAPQAQALELLLERSSP